MIDSYAHLGMPRFWALPDYEQVMAYVGIERALICPFDSCPDIAECHRAILKAPDRFRAFGLSLGRDQAEVTRGIRAQMDAGFTGIRLGDTKIAEQSWILDVLGDMAGIPMVVGSHGLSAGAPVLLKFLDRFPNAVIVSAHFAGPSAPAILYGPGPVRELFAHPRFNVVMSRQGLFDSKMLDDWSAALVDVVGWQRLMWGSESPVPIWRDEKIARTPDWIARLTPDEHQRQAFFGGNAERVVFAREARPVSALALPFDPWDFEVKLAAPMFPYGLAADTKIVGRLVHAWLAAGGEEVQPLSAFLCTMLDTALTERGA